jgi:hypothetical protein
MAVDVDWPNAGKVFEDIAARLAKASANDVVTRAVGKAIGGAIPELEAAARGGAERLPKSGGLAGIVSGTPISHREIQSPGFYNLKLTAQPGPVRDPGRINRGRLAHLTYGRPPWVFQDVPKGWFTDPLKAESPMLRARAEAAMRSALKGV